MKKTILKHIGVGLVSGLVFVEIIKTIRKRATDAKNTNLFIEKEGGIYNE